MVENDRYLSPQAAMILYRILYYKNTSSTVSAASVSPARDVRQSRTRPTCAERNVARLKDCYFCISSNRSKLGESAQERKSCSAALFGVELHTEDIAVRDGAGDAGSVVLGGGVDIGGIKRAGVEGVNVIHMVPLAHVTENCRALVEIQTVISHMGNDRITRENVGQGADLAADESESAMLAELVALIKKKLHTEAYSEQGLSALDLGKKSFNSVRLKKQTRGVAECADSGKHDTVCISKVCGPAGNDAIRADRGERAFE